ncbi:hypothetical protein SH580_19125 [Coraliomargarita algicola]|uniref:Type 4 fimbrial biogenesis protein PilX N-terminal domain-containing protein n=1 Tax=Coraliomargarita algicola TaxID=3092156 RepID=A0ABZ0RKC2_9BACT|nr:hypothetical protein [Coraliomargarita sp. J2-16]WPJ95533.1 hypothetical protein SH580_19125 [Coraliomargarita sp. J2-16]
MIQLIHRTQRKQGFAIVIALALMGFTLVLLLILSTFVRVESRASDIKMVQLRAKQNAYLSAMLALGELQKHTGPDQRITARAEILDRSNELTSPNATTSNELATNRYWTGVWSSEAPDPSSLATGEPETFSLPGRKEAPIKNQPVLTWLISDLPTTLNNSDREDYPLNYVPGTNAVSLFNGNNSSTTADDLRIIPSPIKADTESDTGHFAWWISDEGVKASVRPSEASLSLDSDQRYSLASYRMAPEVIANTTEAIDLASLDAQSDYARLSSLPQLENLLESAAYPTIKASQVPRLFFHDLTLNHQALPTNVRDGGLKQDLSIAFADNAQFNNFINQNGVLLFGPAEKTVNNYDDTTAFDPFTAGTGSSAYSYGYDNPRDAGGPTWDQFKSFFNLSTTATSIPPALRLKLNPAFTPSSATHKF